MTACIDHGRRSNVGYARSGSAYATGKIALAHRKAFFDANGYLPPVVMHTCDNPRCVNPEHLVPGDWAANNRDRAAKGRSAKVRHDLRRVSYAQAQEIRRRWALKKLRGKDPVNGVLKLSQDFGIDTHAVYNIVKGLTHAS